VPFDPTIPQPDIAELYEWNLQNGANAFFTSFDKSIPVGINTYQPIPIRRSEVKYHSDLQVDKVNVEMGLVGVKVGTQQYSIPTIIKRDFLRNAHCKITLLDRKTGGTQLLFEGWATGEMNYNKGILSVQVGSILDRLQDKFPKIIYSEGCNHAHFDAFCGLDKAGGLGDVDWRETGAIAAGTTLLRVYADIFLFTNHAQGWWNRGELVIGDEKRTVLDHQDGYVLLMTPLWEVPAEDTEFTCTAGCDRTGETCKAKFDNYDNFLGFEYIPKPETLYGGF